MVPRHCTRNRDILFSELVYLFTNPVTFISVTAP